jgi:hypothetical protein
MLLSFDQWIGLVLTIPRTLDNRRRSPERASPTTSRITGDRSTKPIARRAAPVRNIELSRVVALNALIGNKKTTLFFPCWQWLSTFPSTAKALGLDVPTRSYWVPTR